MVPSDAHGCPGCPHPAAGPAISGSGNVNINGKPALRVGDKGMHAACCGANTWEAVKGAPGVFINGKPAHRLGDANQHCGGQGNLIEGSCNVYIGNQTHGGASIHVDAPEEHKLEVQVVFEITGTPLGRARVEVLDSNEVVVASTTTDEDGWIRLDPFPRGAYSLRFPDRWRHASERHYDDV